MAPVTSAELWPDNSLRVVTNVVLLTRGPPRCADGWRAVTWDATTVGDWVEDIEGADAIVHLSGRPVDTRASRRNIDELT